MTDAQTTNDARALVTWPCTRTVVLGAILSPSTAFTAVRRSPGCQVLVQLQPARIRIGRNAPSSAPAALPRSP